MRINDIRSCDFGAVRTITGVQFVVGCHDAEDARYKVTFGDGTVLELDASCKSPLHRIGRVRASNVSIQMLRGGGDDGAVEFWVWEFHFE